MKQPSYPCSCIVCRRETSSLGIDTHFLRSHGTEVQKTLWQKRTDLASARRQNKIQQYQKSPKMCGYCHLPIPFEKRENDFCSHSCSASKINQDRIISGWTMSSEARDSIRQKLSKPKNRIYKKQQKSSGPYSKLFRCTCKFCQSITLQRTNKQTCPKCAHLKWNNHKDQYSFKFNVFHFPDLFDLDKIKTVGWVSFGGKRGGVRNPNGLSRDHKVSINDAKINNYDPYYISHPCNCDVIPMIDNNKKKTQSSISYEKLVELVDAYDMLRGGR